MVKRGVFILSFAFACNATPAPTIKLEGHKAIAVEGKTRLPVFDKDHPPSFVVRPPMKITVTLVSRPGVAMDAVAAVGTSSSTVTLTPPDLRGDHVLSVKAGSAEQRYLVRWGPPMDKESPEELSLLAKDEDLTTRFWAVDALAMRAYKGNRPFEAVGLWSEFKDPTMGEEGLDLAASRLRLAAYVLITNGRYNAAPDLLARAEQFARRLEDHKAIARTVYLRGLLRRSSGERLRARRLFEEAADKARAAKAQSDARRFEQMKALSLADLGRFVEGIEVLRRSEPPHSASERERGEHAANLAWLYVLAMKQGDLKPDFGVPLALHQRAYKLFGKDRPVEQYNQAARIAYVMFLENDPRAEQAIEALQKKHPDDFGPARWFVELLRIELLLRREAFDLARRNAERTIELLKTEHDSPLNPDLCDAYILLGEAWAGAGHDDRAIDAFRMATQRAEHLARALAVPKTRARAHHSRRKLAIAYARALLRKGAVEPALSVLDRARAVLLQELEAEAQVENRAEAWRRYDRARAVYEEGQKRGCTHLTKKKSISACRAAQAQAARRAERFLSEFHRDGHTTRNGPSVRPLQVAKRLKLDAALLVSGTADTPLVFVLSTGQVRALSGSGALTDALIATEGARHLYVVPPEDETSSLLGDIERALGAARSVSLIPHLGILLQKGATPTGPPLVIADPDTTLPHALKEGRLVVARLGGRTFEGSAASREEILKRLPSAETIHFAGHAVPANNAWGDRLILSGGRTISIEDLLITRPSAHLVFLSACRSGPITRGARDTLPSVLLHLGVRAVVATTQPLKDGEAAAFVDAFYSANGANRPAQAFRTAVLDAVRRGDHVHKHFRLWGRPAFEEGPDTRRAQTVGRRGR